MLWKEHGTWDVLILLEIKEKRDILLYFEIKIRTYVFDFMPVTWTWTDDWTLTLLVTSVFDYVSENKLPWIPLTIQVNNLNLQF